MLQCQQQVLQCQQQMLQCQQHTHVHTSAECPLPSTSPYLKRTPHSMVCYGGLPLHHMYRMFGLRTSYRKLNLLFLHFRIPLFSCTYSIVKLLYSATYVHMYYLSPCCYVIRDCEVTFNIIIKSPTKGDTVPTKGDTVAVQCCSHFQSCMAVM